MPSSKQTIDAARRFLIKFRPLFKHWDSISPSGSDRGFCPEIPKLYHSRGGQSLKMIFRYFQARTRAGVASNFLLLGSSAHPHFEN